MKSDTSWVTYYTLNFKIVTLFFEVFLEPMLLKGRQINWKILVVEFIFDSFTDWGPAALSKNVL